MKELEIVQLELQDTKNQLSIKQDEMVHFEELAKSRAKLLTTKEIEITKLKQTIALLNEDVDIGINLLKDYGILVEKLLKLTKAQNISSMYFAVFMLFILVLQIISIWL